VECAIKLSHEYVDEAEKVLSDKSAEIMVYGMDMDSSAIGRRGCEL
jgi:hypothetical protein